ncbi:helix-turn-helix domain-containing protein [Brevibacillus sp. NRS-1366]|uniref:helix-turn-helix domain-containing protein n=1 Tax=Brevibacillus sp. NRS-1366 TaxID=3233899 RepID=UPI003D1E1565
MINSLFAERVAKLRTENNMTLETFGELIGLTKSSVGNIEKMRKPASLDVVYKIAEQFNVSIDYLLGRTDNPEINK